MKELPAFRVTILTEEGLRWSRAFVGRRPTKGEVVDAISSDSRHLSYFTTLVQEHWPADANLRICTYAGVKVGRIEVQSIEAQIVLGHGK